MPIPNLTQTLFVVNHDWCNWVVCFDDISQKIIHQSKFFNRVLMPFPKIPHPTVDSQRVWNTINTYKRGFFQWTISVDAISQDISKNQQVGALKWIFKKQKDTGNKYCCHCIVNVNIIHYSEFPNRVLIPFPRIPRHALYTKRVLITITTNERDFFCSSQLLMSFSRIYPSTIKY